MIRARVTRDYKRAYDDPIRMRAGEIVRTGKTDPEFPGWIWCEHDDGRSGWVLEKYLEIENDHAIAREDYCALELTVTAGQELEVLKSESGWAFCKSSSGEAGWVPQTHLEAMRSTTDEH